MLHLEGVEPFPAPPAVVAATLADAGKLAHALPDTEVTSASPDRAAWKVKPKVTFIAGAIDSEAEVVSRDGTASVRYKIITKAVGSGSTVDATLAFDPAEGGTAVRWALDVTELTGLLKMVPKGLLQATAQKVIVDILTAVKAKIAETGNATGV